MRASAILLLSSNFLLKIAAWQCDSIEIDAEHYDLSALDGEYAIKLSTKTPPTLRHTLYDINPCSSLHKKTKLNKEDQCAPGTLICRTTSVEKDGKATIIEVAAFASDIKGQKHPEVSLLNSTVAEDANGLSITYNSEKDTEEPRRTSVIHFICDKDAGTGNPVLSGEDQEETLMLTWRTVSVCGSSKDPDEDHKRPDKGDQDRPRHRSSGWGFFTWLFIIVFMCIAACLIFTLFLNYNRYGQLGLDLVPTMDSVKVLRILLASNYANDARMCHISSRTLPIRLWTQ